MKYKDLDHAVKSCLKMLEKHPGATVWFGIADLKSAFCMIPLAQKFWKVLLLKARNPGTEKWNYFADKCLPFGASISCTIFQKISNALAHILKCRADHILYKEVSNYLDHFLNATLSKLDCDSMLMVFHCLCKWLNVPIATKKTIWSKTRIVFLGILLDGKLHILALPVEKVSKANDLLLAFINKKKATVKEIQRLVGLLNFLHKAIYPGCTFTRRMYAKLTLTSSNGKKLRHYHHISLDREFRQDCITWLKFLEQTPRPAKFCRLFLDLHKLMEAADLGFHIDSSACEVLGIGGVCGKQWFWGKWEKGYIKNLKPSIAYLELYAVTVGIYIWSNKFRNKRLILRCDNMLVVQMVNDTSSGCKRCMHLIRLIVLRSLEFNFRIFSVHVRSR